MPYRVRVVQLGRQDPEVPAGYITAVRQKYKRRNTMISFLKSASLRTGLACLFVVSMVATSLGFAAVAPSVSAEVEAPVDAVELSKLVEEPGRTG